MSEHFTVYLRPQPDEMTFDQCLKHARRAMYWSGAHWCDISLYRLEGWKLLEGQLKAAHERETNALRDENERMRDLMRDVVEGLSLDDIRDWPYGHRLRILGEARKLGIEVDG